MPKRYYWIKLKEDFFRQREIKKLRKIANGDTYTVIYLKLLLLSIQSDGKLFFDGVEDDFASEMALVIDESPENVGVTIRFLLTHGILIQENEVEYLLVTAQTMTGSETDSAHRVREYRLRKEQSNAILLPCNSNVTELNTEKEERRKDSLVQDSPEREKYSQDFERLWQVYPKHQAKSSAFQAFRKISVPVQELIDAVKNQKGTDEWRRDGGRYIPLLATWLINERWLDEIGVDVSDDSQKPEFFVGEDGEYHVRFNF